MGSLDGRLSLGGWRRGRGLWLRRVLDLRGCSGFRYRRSRGFVHCLKGLFVDLRALFRNRLDLHVGLQFFQKVRRQVEVAQVFALLDGVKWVDDRGNLEYVLGNPGDGREEDQVNQDREPEAPIAPLASPSPLVGHQTFADSIFFQTNAPGFQNDNIANLSLQGDENGRVNALFRSEERR